MKLKIRKPTLEPMIDGGTPKDFADVKDYFNKALRQNTLPWIPRKNPITDEEIRKLWIPSLEANINLVAEYGDRVVGQVTVFYDPKSTAYEHAKERVPGSIGFTADPHFYAKAARLLFPALIAELKAQDKKAILTTAYESPGNSLMEGLGYTPRILTDVKRYKDAGLSGKVCEYRLP